MALDQDAGIWLDVEQFRSLLTRGREQKDILLRASLLSEAIQLYRDHFLSGFTLKGTDGFNEWVFSTSEELSYLLTGALTNLADDYCSLGQPGHAIPYLRRLLTLDPLSESAHRRMMKTYIQAGQRSAALKQYRALEEILRKELNLDPQPETYALYKQIRKGELATGPIEHPKEVNTSRVNSQSHISTNGPQEIERDHRD